MAKKENTTSIGFEEIIWRAADKLRGNLNASEYEGVVLGLIFLKYISDKFEAKYEELKEDEYADVEDRDEEHRGLVLVSPIHYLKNIYLYSIDNGLMDKHAEELEEMDLPFKWQYIPLDYPQPEFYI